MRGSWSLGLPGEDNTSLSTEEETRWFGVYAFGARTTPNSLIEEEARSRDEGSWSLRLRGEDKRVYPLRKRREVLGSTPSGRGQNEFIH